MGINLRAGESGITGYVAGVYNKESNGFSIKRGKTKNGKKYQVFAIKVSSKDKDSGEWTNGKNIEVMLFGDTKVEEKQLIGLVGRFVPNNYENKDGKTVYGSQFLAFEDGIFTPDSWGKKETKKEAPVEEDDNPWAD